jgi:hypothetical protein
MLVMPPILVTSIIPNSEDVSDTAIRSAGVLFGFVALFTLSLVNTAAGSGALTAKNGPACRHNHATHWDENRAVCAVCSASVTGYWKCDTCADAWGAQFGVHCRSCTRQPEVWWFRGRPRCVLWEHDRNRVRDKRCCACTCNVFNLNLDTVLAYLQVGFARASFLLWVLVADHTLISLFLICFVDCGGVRSALSIHVQCT